MSTLSDWNAYMDVVHSLALVEDDLRETAGLGLLTPDAAALAERILWERFDVHAV